MVNIDWKYAHINAIKRLSDGFVIRVGEKCLHNGVETSVFIITLDGDDILNLDEFNPIPKPLFVTEDGVEIFEGDTIYPVELKYFKLHLNAKAPSYSRKPEKFKIFSTKEKAEEFQLYNKPLLSLEDILTVWGVGDRKFYKESPLFQNVKRAAEQKLTNNK